MDNSAFTPDDQTETDGEVIGLRPLVPEGIYTLAYYGHYTYFYFGKSPKLALRFRIAEKGKYFDTPVERIYNVKRLIGKPQEGGNFEVGGSSKLAYEFCKLCPERIKRLDRIPLSFLKPDLFEGRIETVTRNFEQREIPLPLTYSVVRELIGPAP